MKKAKEHLQEVNETYFEHFINASRYALKLLYCSIVCFVHAIIPGLFVGVVSKVAKDICNDVEKRKSKQ